MGSSAEIASLHLDRVDGEIGAMDVTRLSLFGRQAARIEPQTAVVEFITATMRQGKGGVAIANACQRLRETNAWPSRPRRSL